MWKKLDHSYIAGRNVKLCIHSGKVWQFLNKNKTRSIIQPNNCTPGHLSQENEDLCSHRNLHMSIIAASFVRVKNWKPRWSFNRCMTKQTVVHSYYERVLCKNKNATAQKPPENYAEWKGPRLHSVWVHLCDILEMMQMEMESRWEAVRD